MIKLFVTGGTMDAATFDEKTEFYTFAETHLPKMLEQGRSKADIKIEVLMQKDSSLMDDVDRNKIIECCRSCAEDRVIITHGTNTMPETAAVLGRSITDKTIVLTGAMELYVEPFSDALFNLGSAITAVQLLPHGVYIAMNGKIFTWDDVRKDKEAKVFTTIAS